MERFKKRLRAYSIFEASYSASNFQADQYRRAFVQQGKRRVWHFN